MDQFNKISTRLRQLFAGGVTVKLIFSREGLLVTRLLGRCLNWGEAKG
jgi:hypothetical protein